MTPTEKCAVRSVRVVAMLAACLLTGAPVAAQTFDGVTPAEEDVCDGLPEAAYGLCNAYCEAIDCDARGDDFKACDSLRNNYFEATGNVLLPCDWSCPAPPDPTCSGNGVLTVDENGCEVCACDPNWSGAACTTCDPGFDNCGICGGPNVCGGA
jgi:hypothetical protein